ncbi:hypothetical protein [Maribacter halichondriae]|uniref:hypothetical protein n=1 Tax=Maribacter halichondriae TaxID=2980554 RepID=UPI00235978A2|nr:hypothetical protein [Maribacter sp. Hal144]
MKNILKLIHFSLLVLALSITSCVKEGPEGPIGSVGAKGEQGIQGENGNANVKAFELIVNKSDWMRNLHYGGGNVYRAFEILPESIGNIDLYSFNQGGGTVLLYGLIEYSGDTHGAQQERKPLPFMTSVNKGADYFGLKLEFSLAETPS